MATKRVKAGPAKTGMIRARVDPALKVRVDTILGNLGMNSSDAIRLYYSQIVLHEGLPFPLKIPNAATREALRDADAGVVNRYASTDDMFKKMGI